MGHSVEETGASRNVTGGGGAGEVSAGGEVGSLVTCALVAAGLAGAGEVGPAWRSSL